MKYMILKNSFSRLKIIILIKHTCTPGEKRGFWDFAGPIKMYLFLK